MSERNNQINEPIPTGHSPSRRRALRVTSLTLAAALSMALLAGCGSLESVTGLSLPQNSSSSNSSDDTEDSSSTDGTADNASESKKASFNSDFTKRGVAHVHKIIDGIDYSLDIFPSQATARTDRWYPRGEKRFTFTFQTYDLSQPLSASYGLKRMVYLGNVSISSSVTDEDGSDSGVSPYTKVGNAAQMTFDPEPITFQNYGMRIASPKGVFEMRNQVIGDLPASAIGVTLHFRFYTTAQRTAGSDVYDGQTIDIDIPIGITTSNQVTPIEEVPADAS